MLPSNIHDLVCSNQDQFLAPPVNLLAIWSASGVQAQASLSLATTCCVKYRQEIQNVWYALERLYKLLRVIHLQILQIHLNSDHLMWNSYTAQHFGVPWTGSLDMTMMESIKLLHMMFFYLRALQVVLIAKGLGFVPSGLKSLLSTNELRKSIIV